MKLSIITVCLNAAEIIEKTIKSVLDQSIPVFEYIIIDGASSDNTIKIVESYKDTFTIKGIHFFYISEKDYGISDAFNKGIKKASGDYIGLINAGDEILKYTTAIITYFCKKETADIYYGNCIWEDNKNKLSFVLKPKEQNPDKLSKLLYEMVLIHPSVFIRKRSYIYGGLYNITYKYCMDQELLYRMYKQNMKFCYINEVLTKFMAGGISDSNPCKVFKEASRIAIDNGELKFKVIFIEKMKLLRDFLARKFKALGGYRLLRKKYDVIT